MGELDQWLEGIGLGQYAEILAREHVDLALLPALTDHDLRALGLPLGHRRGNARPLSPGAGGSTATVLRGRREWIDANFLSQD